MNHESTQAILTDIKNEIEITKKCITDVGFIERITARLIPMFRDHTLSKEVIKNWEDKITEEAQKLEIIAQKACEELTSAFQELWKELVSKPKNSLRQGKIGSIYSYMVNDIKADRFLIGIMKGACEGGVCKYVKPPIEFAYERLRNIYCERIARSWDFCFAPHASQYLESTSSREIAARSESIPHFAWKYLIDLTMAWGLRNKQLRVGGGRVRGEKRTVLYRAHQADAKARFNYFAEDLKRCNAQGERPQIFQQIFFHYILDKLVFELEIALQKTNYQAPIFTVNEDSHGSTKKYQDDLQKLVPLCTQEIQRYEGKNSKPTLNKLISRIQMLIEDNGTKLNNPTTTRIKEAIRQARADLKGRSRTTKSRCKPDPIKRPPKSSSQNQNHRLKRP